MDYFGYISFLYLIIHSLLCIKVINTQYHGDYILSPYHTHNHPSKVLFKPESQDLKNPLPTQVPWEEVLKETVFHTLNNKKRRIVEGGLQKNSKFKEAIFKAPYIGALDPNAPRFGDIVLLAKGQLIKNRDETYYFLQLDNNNKQHNISNNATAVWKVEQIRHRSAETQSGHKYDLKFTVFPLEKRDVTIDREVSKRIGKSFILKDDDYPKYFARQGKQARSYGQQSEKPDTATRRMFFGPDIFTPNEPEFYPPALGSAYQPIQHYHVHQYQYRPNLNTGELYLQKIGSSKMQPFPFAMPYVPLASTNRIRFPDNIKSSTDKLNFNADHKVINNYLHINKYQNSLPVSSTHSKPISFGNGNLIDLRGASENNKITEKPAFNGVQQYGSNYAQPEHLVTKQNDPQQQSSVRHSQPSFVPSTFGQQNPVLIGNQQLQTTTAGQQLANFINKHYGVGQSAHNYPQQQYQQQHQQQQQPILFTPVSATTTSSGGQTPLLLKIPFQFVTPINHIIVAQTEIPITSLHYTQTPIPTQLHHSTNIVSPLPQLPRYTIPIDLGRDQENRVQQQNPPNFVNDYQAGNQQRPRHEHFTSPPINHQNSIHAGFKESPRLNKQIKYSEPDPLYNHGRYLGDRQKKPDYNPFSSTSAPQIETPIITSTDYVSDDNSYPPTAPSANELITPASEFEDATHPARPDDTSSLDDVEMHENSSPTNKPDSINAQLSAPERGHDASSIPYVDLAFGKDRYHQESHIMQAGSGPQSSGPSATGPSSPSEPLTGPSFIGLSSTGPSTTGPSATGPSATGPETTAHEVMTSKLIVSKLKSNAHNRNAEDNEGKANYQVTSHRQRYSTTTTERPVLKWIPKKSTTTLKTTPKSKITPSASTRTTKSTVKHTEDDEPQKVYLKKRKPYISSLHSNKKTVVDYAEEKQNNYNDDTDNQKVYTKKRIPSKSSAEEEPKDDSEQKKVYKKKRIPFDSWQRTNNTSESTSTNEKSNNYSDDHQKLYPKKRIPYDQSNNESEATASVEEKRKYYGSRRRLGPKFTTHSTTTTTQASTNDDSASEESNEIEQTHTEQSYSTSVSVEVGGNQTEHHNEHHYHDSGKPWHTNTEPASSKNESTDVPANRFDMVKADIQPIHTNTSKILMYHAIDSAESKPNQTTTTSDSDKEALQNITYSILNHARAISSTPRPNRRTDKDMKFIKKRRSIDSSRRNSTIKFVQ